MKKNKAIPKREDIIKFLTAQGNSYTIAARQAGTMRIPGSRAAAAQQDGCSRASGKGRTTEGADGVFSDGLRSSARTAWVNGSSPRLTLSRSLPERVS